MPEACEQLEIEVVNGSAASALRGRRGEPAFVNDSVSEIPPELLAERAQGGCAESFEGLVRHFEGHLFNFLRQFTRTPQDAEDLTQETFLKAYRGLPGYKPALKFAPWLFTIARRTAANHHRSFVQFEELPDDAEIAAENPADLLESHDEQDSVWRLAHSLKPKQREVLWLRYGEGFSVAETAAIMGSNQIYVKVLLHRARTNLARLLSQSGTRRKAKGSL